MHFYFGIPGRKLLFHFITLCLVLSRAPVLGGRSGVLDEWSHYKMASFVNEGAADGSGRARSSISARRCSPIPENNPRNLIWMPPSVSAPRWVSCTLNWTKGYRKKREKVQCVRFEQNFSLNVEKWTDINRMWRNCSINVPWEISAEVSGLTS